MGYYHRYMEGNLVIVPEQLERIDVARLIATYHLSEEQIARDRTDTEKWYAEHPYEGWSALSEQQRFAVAVISQVASEEGWSGGFGQAEVEGRKLDGVTLFFDERNYWSWAWLEAIERHLLNGTYAQCSNDDGDVFRLVVKDGKIIRIEPSWIV